MTFESLNDLDARQILIGCPITQVEEEIKVVTYIAAEGDISTDLLSPGNQAHSRADRELHGKCMITPEAQAEIQALQAANPGARVFVSAWSLSAPSACPCRPRPVAVPRNT